MDLAPLKRPYQCLLDISAPQPMDGVVLRAPIRTIELGHIFNIYPFSYCIFKGDV